MKKPLSMPEEQQPRNTLRADLLMTEGFGLEVDGRMKTAYPTEKAAHENAIALKTKYPMLQVKIYDAAKKIRDVVELPGTVKKVKTVEIETEDNE